MKLYIRSQDRQHLMAIDNINIYTIELGKAKIYTDMGIDLGFYKTEKRALEVLDEIQKILMNNTLESSIAKCYKLDNYVYEMPEE